MTETELIDRACEGDEDAIRALYERHSPRVYAVVRRIAGSDDQAEDWAQEAWIRAIRALPSFRGDARFSTWLHRIAVNAALQGRRRRKSRKDREEPLDPRIPAENRKGDALLRERLEEAVDLLPDGMREVLLLHEVEGFTHAEIGERLGIAPGTSKSQLYKARVKLRKILAPVKRERDGGMEAWST